MNEWWWIFPRISLHFSVFSLGLQLFVSAKPLTYYITHTLILFIKSANLDCMGRANNSRKIAASTSDRLITSFVRFSSYSLLILVLRHFNISFPYNALLYHLDHGRFDCRHSGPCCSSKQPGQLIFCGLRSESMLRTCISCAPRRKIRSNYMHNFLDGPSNECRM